jgi:hypothetical protein
MTEKESSKGPKYFCRKINDEYGGGDFYAYYRANSTVDVDFVSVAISTFCPSLRVDP